MFPVDFSSMNPAPKSKTHPSFSPQDRHAKVIRSLLHATNLAWIYINEQSIEVLERAALYQVRRGAVLSRRRLYGRSVSGISCVAAGHLWVCNSALATQEMSTGLAQIVCNVTATGLDSIPGKIVEIPCRTYPVPAALAEPVGSYGLYGYNRVLISMWTKSFEINSLWTLCGGAQ